MLKKKGYFIVIEGIDGAGSSTQADLLYHYFLDRQEKAIISPEPTKGKIGKLLREFLGEKNPFSDQDLFDRQMAYLFAADRHYHLYNNNDGVMKLTQDNVHIITTRYYFSSLAYNAKTPQEEEFVSFLNRDFPPPDILIYLDIPVEIALTRIDDRQKLEIYETKEKLINVKSNFEKILANYSHNYLKVYGNKSKEEIHQNIVNFIENYGLHSPLIKQG